MYGSYQGYQSNPTPTFPSRSQGEQQLQQLQPAPAQGFGGGQLVQSSSSLGLRQSTTDPWNRQQLQSYQAGMPSSQAAQMVSQNSYGQHLAPYGQQGPSQPIQQQQQALSHYQQQQQRLYQPQNQPSSLMQTQAQQQQTVPATTGTDELTDEEKALYQPLSSASESINSSMDADNRNVPKLDEYLNVKLSTQYDIPDPDLPQPFVTSRHHDLPKALFDKLSSKKASVAQGLFPEIARAWFVIDGQLYLWDWTTDKLDRCDEGAAESITAVGLARPKRSVISDDIQWILVLCTITGVTLLGLSIGKDSQLQVFSLPGLKVNNPSQTYMTSVQDAADGRIFLTASDTCLHELEYEKEKGWFSSRQCRLSNCSTGSFYNILGDKAKYGVTRIAVDSEQRIVYALTSKSSIQVWTWPANGGQLSHLSTATDLVQKAQQTTAASAALDVTRGVKIVSISVVGAEISSAIQLIAITSTGARLYYALQYQKDLVLQHLYLPADHMTQPLQGQSKEGIPPWGQALPISRASSGVLALVTAFAQGQDSFVILSTQSLARALALPTIRSYNPSAGLEETFTAIPQYNGRIVTDIGELPHPLTSAAKVRGTINARPGSNVVQSELVTEVTVPENRKFLVLAHDGLDVIVKSRPLDSLAELMGQEMQGLLPLLDKWSQRFESRPTEVCAISIALGALSCAAGSLDSGVSMSHTAAPGLVSDWLRHYGTKMEQKHAQQSGLESSLFRERGLSAHLSRVLRPIWGQPVVKLVTIPSHYDTAVPAKVLEGVQRNLLGLKTFVTSYPTAFGYEQEAYMPGNAAAETLKQRKAKFDPLVKLMEQTIEAISFVLLLIEFNLPITLSRASPELSAELSRISYQALVTTKGGREIAKQLVTSLMQQQIGQQVSIDTITRTLQSRCGSFCRPEDVILYKAMECIRKAKDSRSSEAREQFLGESLQLFLESVSAISREKVRDICVEYRQMQFPQGAVRLPLACAHQTDSDGKALTYWEGLVTETLQEATDQGRAAFDRRVFFYNLVTDSLEAFDEQLSRQLENGINANGVDAERIREIAFDIVMSSSDEMFHMHLYDWMVKHGREDELLSLTTQDVERYLQHKLQNAGENINHDLLWKYYARRGQHRSAAHALSNLAVSTRYALPLDVRVQYLSSALANAKSSTQSHRLEERATVAEITELEERTEVANVQAEVWAAVMQDDYLDDETRAEQMARLESKLMDVQELYNKYAEPLGLLECQLLILHVSDFRDPEVVEAIWAELLQRAQDRDVEGSVRKLHDLVVRLGKRFYPSPAAFPFEFIFEHVLGRGYDMRQSAPIGWVVRAFREGNVPWQDIWTCAMSLRGGVPPFGEPAGMDYIDEELSVLLPAWLTEHREAALHGDNGYLPAADVDAYVNSWLLDHAGKPKLSDSRVARVKDSFSNVQRELRRRF